MSSSVMLTRNVPGLGIQGSYTGIQATNYNAYPISNRISPDVCSMGSNRPLQGGVSSSNYATANNPRTVMYYAANYPAVYVQAPQVVYVAQVGPSPSYTPRTPNWDQQKVPMSVSPELTSNMSPDTLASRTNGNDSPVSSSLSPQPAHVQGNKVLDPNIE